MARFTMVPFKALSDPSMYKLDKHAFVFLNYYFNFVVSLHNLPISCIIKKLEKFIHFSSQKNEGIFHIFIKLRYQGLRRVLQLSFLTYNTNVRFMMMPASDLLIPFPKKLPAIMLKVSVSLNSFTAGTASIRAATSFTK